MADRTCSLNGCDRKHYGRGRCRNHYAQHQRTRDADPGEQACRADNCTVLAYANELCFRHYQRVRNTGSLDLIPRERVVLPPCSVSECDEQSITRGLCQLHYDRVIRTGTTADPRHRTRSVLDCRAADPVRWQRDVDRFWSNVDVRELHECWPCTLASDGDGYSQVGICGEQFRAHRVAYETSVGRLPDGEVARHDCDNPPCCNPAHIVPGTQRDNADDAVTRGRWTHGEAHGRTKLTTRQVDEVCALLADGLGPTAIGRRYGVSKTQVMRIRDGKSRVNG